MRDSKSAPSIETVRRGGFVSILTVLLVIGLITSPESTQGEGARSSDSVAQQDTANAHRFLGEVRGASPAACQLLNEAISNRWGWGGNVHPQVGPFADSNARALVQWARGRHEDVRLLGDLQRYFSDDDACVRRTAAHLIRVVADTAAVRAFVERELRSADVRVREAAVAAAGYADTHGARARLEDALQQDVSVDVRRVAAWALGVIEDERSVGALARALDRDDDAAVRAHAAWALGQTEVAAAIEPLARALTADNSAVVRRHAAWGLGAIEQAAIIPHLADALAREPDSSVRQTIAWALGQID